MPAIAAMPGPCALCGSLLGRRRREHWWCAICRWRYGDAPDPDLPMPKIEVVYYLRSADRVKIGTSGSPRQRLAALGQGELLAFELGGRALEQQRHRDFADQRVGGEWFTAADPLLSHIAAIAAVAPPWDAYARWVADALRGR